MSQLKLSRIDLYVLLILILWGGALALPIHASGNCEDPYTNAIRLMRAFFPELSGKNAVMDIEAQYPFDSDGPLLAFYIRTSESDQKTRIVASPYPNPSSADRLGHLSARFQFDGRDHSIFLVFVSGSLVNDKKQETLASLADKHPNWSEAQMTDALSAAGAKFGPGQGDAILTRFPFKDLEPLLGKIEHKSAEFTFRGNKEPPFYAVMQWTLRFQAIKDGKKAEYTASLEPFDGRVVSFGRRALN